MAACCLASTIFLDRTSWRSIASGAADGEVRWSLVTDGGCRTAPFYCHHGMVHSLASDPRSASVRRWAQLGMRVCSSLHPRVACVAQVFLSGSQDGTVRQFDVREPHNGNCQGSDLLSTCSNVLVDLRHAAMDGGAVGVREVVLNPMNPSACGVSAFHGTHPHRNSPEWCVPVASALQMYSLLLGRMCICVCTTGKLAGWRAVRNAS